MMAKPPENELGVSGISQWAGRITERYLSSLDGPAGIIKMAEVLRREPSAYVANRLVQQTVAQAKWEITPATDGAGDRQAAEFVQQCLNDMSDTFTKALAHAMSSEAFGFSDLEIVYKRRLGLKPGGNKPVSRYDDGYIGLRKLGVRRQETIESWEFDDHGGCQAMIQINPNDNQQITIPIERLVHFIGGDDRGNWEGMGWLEPAYGIYHRIVNFEIIEGIGAERAHVGLPVARWQQKPDANDRADMQAIMRNLIVNEQQYVELPGPTVEFELLTVTNTNADATRIKINQLRWEMMSLVVATFMRMGTTESGSRALADPIVDAFTMGIDAALADKAATFNRHLIPKLINFNEGRFRGMTEPPRLEFAKVTGLPYFVLQHLITLQDYLERAEPEDQTWLRKSLGMPSLIIDRPEPEDPPEEPEEDAVEDDVADEETVAPEMDDEEADMMAQVASEFVRAATMLKEVCDAQG